MKNLVELIFDAVIETVTAIFFIGLFLYLTIGGGFLRALTSLVHWIF